jgi:hypothetical protein
MALIFEKEKSGNNSGNKANRNSKHNKQYNQQGREIKYEATPAAILPC